MGRNIIVSVLVQYRKQSIRTFDLICDGQTNRQSDRQTDIQIDRQTDIQADGQTDRQTDGQINGRSPFYNPSSATRVC